VKWLIKLWKRLFAREDPIPAISPNKLKYSPHPDEFLHSLLVQSTALLLQTGEPMHFFDDHLRLEDVARKIMVGAVAIYRLDDTRRPLMPKELVKMKKFSKVYAEYADNGNFYKM
jgi:hypothetical protein